MVIKKIKHLVSSVANFVLKLNYQLLFDDFTFLCMCMPCCVCVCMLTHIHVLVEVNLELFLWQLTILFFETRLLTGLDSADYVRLADQRIPVVHLSLSQTLL